MKKIVLILALCTLTMSAVGAEKTSSFTLFERFAFDAPAGTKVENAGVEAFKLSRDKDAWIVVNFYNKDMIASMPKETISLANFKATFMATAKPATQKVDRTILGKKITGERQEVSIPKRSVLEAYEVKTSLGILFVGLKRMDTYDEKKAVTFFDQVIGSLKMSGEAK